MRKRVFNESELIKRDTIYLGGFTETELMSNSVFLNGDMGYISDE